MEEIIYVFYKAGYTDKEIAEKLNLDFKDILEWRLERKLPKNKANKTSRLRESLDIEDVGKMLLFLYLLDSTGKRCMELGYKPDVSKFITVYRNYNLYDYMRKGLPEII